MAEQGEPGGEAGGLDPEMLAGLAEGLGIPGADVASALASSQAGQDLAAGKPPSPEALAQLGQELGVPGADVASALAGSQAGQDLAAGQVPSLQSMTQLGQELGVPGADAAAMLAGGLPPLPAGHSVPAPVPESWTTPAPPPPPIPGAGPIAGPGWFILRAVGPLWAPAAAFGAAAPLMQGLEMINVELVPGALLPHVEFIVLVGSVTATLAGVTVTLGQWDFLTCLPAVPRTFAAAGAPCAMLVL